MNEDGSYKAVEALDDDELLRRFRETCSDEAFAEIVERFKPLVYGVSLRSLRNRELAEDATHVVFLVLAQKAAAVHNGRALASWLFRTTDLTARRIAGQERRRRMREQQWMEDQIPTSGETAAWDSALWNQVEPALNDALRALRRTDQECVLLHFFQGRTLREVGTAVGISEDAARMRVSRAVERMRLFLERKGTPIRREGLAGLLYGYRAHGVPASTSVKATVPPTSVSRAALSRHVSINEHAKAILHRMIIAKAGAAAAAISAVSALSIGAWMGGTALSRPASPASAVASATLSPDHVRPQPNSQRRATQGLHDEPRHVLETLERVDSALKQGSILYHESALTPLGQVNRRVRLDYASDGRYHRVVTGSLQGRPQDYELIFDGKDEIWVFPDEKEIQFRVPTSLGEFAGKVEPSSAIGRGLSDLKNVSVRRDSTGLRLTGTYGGVVRVEALLDPTRGYLAKERTQTDEKGNIRGRSHLSSPRYIGSGIFVAAKSTGDMVLSGKHLHGEMTVEEMSARAPEPSRFSCNWLRPGYQVTDMRLSPTDPGRFKSSEIHPDTTPEQLLEMTRRQIAFRAKLHADNEAAARTYYQQESAMKSECNTAAAICLAVIIIAAATISRRRHFCLTEGRRPISPTAARCPIQCMTARNNGPPSDFGPDRNQETCHPSHIANLPSL